MSPYVNDNRSFPVEDPVILLDIYSSLEEFERLSLIRRDPSQLRDKLN
jgi:hypothetical protein